MLLNLIFLQAKRILNSSLNPSIGEYWFFDTQYERMGSTLSLFLIGKDMEYFAFIKKKNFFRTNKKRKKKEQ